MRSLLTKLADWWWLRRTARISTLIDDLDHMENKTRKIDARLKDIEAWVDEQRIRAKVRELFDTPDGRAWLDQWFGDQR